MRESITLLKAPELAAPQDTVLADVTQMHQVLMGISRNRVKRLERIQATLNKKDLLALDQLDDRRFQGRTARPDD